jgi:hypothetical protein
MSLTSKQIGNTVNVNLVYNNKGSVSQNIIDSVPNATSKFMAAAKVYYYYKYFFVISIIINNIYYFYYYYFNNNKQFLF